MAIWRLKCFYETFVQGSIAGVLLKFCGENRYIAKAKNVSGHCKTTIKTAKLSVKEIKYQVIKQDTTLVKIIKSIKLTYIAFAKPK